MTTWSAGLEVDQLFKTYKATQVNSAVAVLESKTPVIGLLTKDNPEKTSALIEMMIIDLQAFLNLNRLMNEFQIKETAKLIMQRYNYMKVADCKLIFDRIKTGQVKLYEGLDGQKILQVFEMWSEERWKSADHYNYNKHLESTGHERKNRDKPFLIGDPNAPDANKIAEYMESVRSQIDNSAA